MTTQRSRLTKMEDQEFRARLSRLEKLGILVGCAVDARREPERLTLEQTPGELAGIYELPLDEVAVIVPAKMTILKSGILITDVAMRTPWDDCPLELSDLEECPYYRYLIGGLHRSPELLNPWLERDIPLRPRRMEGVIIAYGYVSVPPQCHDEMLVTVQLLLEDEGRNQLSFEFGVRMDRSVMRKCEPEQRQRREFARSVKGGDLFEPKGGRLRDPESVSRDKQPGKLAVSMTQPATQELRRPHQETGSFSKCQLLKGEADRDASDVDSSTEAQPDRTPSRAR
jgi:hypothetical protein